MLSTFRTLIVIYTQILLHLSLQPRSLILNFKGIFQSPSQHTVSHENSQASKTWHVRNEPMLTPPLT